MSSKPGASATTEWWKSVGRRIVLTTWGSFGDLHPFLAMALELKRRAHRPLLATCELYRSKVEGEGIEFAPLRPDVGNILDHPDLIRRLFHPRQGSEFVIRELMLANLREQWADLRRCADDAELVVSHTITFATPLFAEWKRVPWVSTVLQPAVFFSTYDPPRLRQMEFLRRAPHWLRRVGFAAGRASTRHWFRDYHRLRAELGLPGTSANPLFKGQYSPFGTLALFSPLLASPQPDWPSRVAITGFPFFDRLDASEQALSPIVEGFLAAGEPPLVFTSGSSSVIESDHFFEVSLEAARALSRRAVLLAGPGFERRLTFKHGIDCVVSAYEPHSKLFPRAALIVHQGGIGTTGQALRSGAPQLVAAVSHDQPDNGERVRRLGAGTWMRREKYNLKSARVAIDTLLRDSSITASAKRISEIVREEVGAEIACNVLESVWRPR